jgi:hypothetical protein
MSEMTHQESLERFIEGLKRAESNGRNLGTAQGTPLWAEIAHRIEFIRLSGVKLYESEKPTELQIELMLSQWEGELKAKSDAENGIQPTSH